MSERVPAWAESDERYPEREAEWRAAIARADRAEAALEERDADMHARIRAGYDRTIADSWRAKVAEVTTRAERAEAGLAALLGRLVTIQRSGAPGGSICARRADDHACSWCRGNFTPCPVAIAASALADTAPAAEAYRASVEAPLRAEIERLRKAGGDE